VGGECGSRGSEGLALDRDKGYPLFCRAPQGVVYNLVVVTPPASLSGLTIMCHMCPICTVSKQSLCLLSSSSLYSMYFLQPRTLRSAFGFSFSFLSPLSLFYCSGALYSLLAPGTCIRLTRFHFGLLLLRLLRPYPFTGQQRTLSLAMSSVHTFGECCVCIPLPDNNSISLCPLSVSTPWRVLRPFPFTGQQQFSLLYASCTSISLSSSNTVSLPGLIQCRSSS
jgi:hypothetical protein